MNGEEWKEKDHDDDNEDNDDGELEEQGGEVGSWL